MKQPSEGKKCMTDQELGSLQAIVFMQQRPALCSLTKTAGGRIWRLSTYTHVSSVAISYTPLVRKVKR
jgi:hypothetical protein